MVIRQLTWKGYIESRIDDAIQKYKNMELTIREAAKLAGVNPRDFSWLLYNLFCSLHSPHILIPKYNHVYHRNIFGKYKIIQEIQDSI
ncbi:MAG TPA: hypothetical protein EYP22_09810 [Methanosarcinales archaeon]|nr:hypothetical protein [Methanosarcinales archaeon]